MQLKLSGNLNVWKVDYWFILVCKIVKQSGVWYEVVKMHPGSGFSIYFCNVNWLIFIQGDVGNYYYGQGHPMKPHRIRMTHNLLLNYGLYRKMEIYVSFVARLHAVCVIMFAHISA